MDLGSHKFHKIRKMCLVSFTMIPNDKLKAVEISAVNCLQCCVYAMKQSVGGTIRCHSFSSDVVGGDKTMYVKIIQWILCN